MQNNMRNQAVKAILTIVFLMMPLVVFPFNTAFAGVSPNVCTIDNFNDENLGVNTLGFWTGGNVGSDQLFLHVYDANKNNYARTLTYNCATPQDIYWYASNVWDGVTFLNASNFTHLSFRIKGTEGGEDFYIQLQYGTPIGGGPQPLVEILSSAYVTTTTEWRQVNIPLTAFAGLDKTKMRAVSIEFRNTLSHPQGTIYIDNLSFTKGYPKAQSTGSVQVDRGTKELLVSGQPFAIKGVGYQPTPIGMWPPQPDNSAIFSRDFPLLANMGCNTIKTWSAPGPNLMNKAQQYGLKVIANFWMDYSLDFANSTIRTQTKTNFTTFVNNLKSYPALLMWSIGNENNYYNGANSAYYSLVNELAEIAYQQEGASYHPVMVVNGSLYNIGEDEIGAEDLQLNYIDIWGSNIYAEHFYQVNWYGSTRNYFDVFEEKSTKPLIMTEYGTDAFRTTSEAPVVDGYIDEDAQAEWVLSNALEVMSEPDGCIGGCVMEYSDEWWKYTDGGLPSVHEKNGHSTLSYGHILPDDYSNEEYWGIAEIAADGTWGAPDGIDDIKPRRVYYILQELFTKPLNVLHDGDQIQPVINSLPNGGTVYFTEGTYDQEQDSLVTIEEDINLIGEDAARVNVKANIVLMGNTSDITDITIAYPQGKSITYDGGAYASSPINIIADAGITAINSNLTVKNCDIMPDSNIFGTSKYGKGIQIWNLYENPDIAPVVEDNFIANCEIGVSLFSQAFGGGINGLIRNNNLDGNAIGILERMHKEKPIIEDNNINNSNHGIHITYEDGVLLAERLTNIRNNTFAGNIANVWCDELQAPQQ